MALLKSFGTVGSLTLASRLLGYFRDLALAATFGADKISDVILIALKLPNLFRRLLAEGALSAAFIPLFSSTLEKEGNGSAKDYAAHTFTLLFLILLGLVVIFELLMPAIIMLVAPGFEEVDNKFTLAVSYARIMFPYILFIALGALYSGVLNALNRFAAAAFAPILLNLTVIVAIFTCGGPLEKKGEGVAWAVFVAGILQLLIVAIACHRAGFKIGFTAPTLSPKIRLLFRRMLPGIIGASVYQINLVISDRMASYVDKAVSYLSFADRINQFPLSLIGVSIGTVLLPFMARLYTQSKNEDAAYVQNRVIELSMILSIPATVALFIISTPIIRTLFQHNAFKAEDTIITAKLLSAFALGLPAYVLTKVLGTIFFSVGNTAKPVIAACFAVAANILLNIVFFPFFSFYGVPYALAIASLVNVLILGIWLYKENLLKFDQRIKKTMAKVLLSSVCMGGVLLMCTHTFPEFTSLSWLSSVLYLVLLIFIGLLVYGVALYVTKALTLQEFKDMITRTTNASDVTNKK